MPLLLVLLAVMSKAPARSGSGCWTREPDDLDHTFRATALIAVPLRRRRAAARRASRPDSIARAIATLSNLDRPRVGVMADALLEQAANAMGHRGGEFLSPPSVRKLVVAIAEPTGTVYNPATGVGQLMVDAATERRRKHVQLSRPGDQPAHLGDVAAQPRDPRRRRRRGLR